MAVAVVVGVLSKTSWSALPSRGSSEDVNAVGGEVVELVGVAAARVSTDTSKGRWVCAIAISEDKGTSPWVS